MNLLDRAIGLVAPQAALRRAQARAAMAMLARSYEGARIGRRTEGWVVAGTSANAEIGTAIARLRDAMASRHSSASMQAPSPDPHFRRPAFRRAREERNARAHPTARASSVKSAGTGRTTVASCHPARPSHP